MRYKGFDLTTLIDAGGDVHSMTYAWGVDTQNIEELQSDVRLV
jgi:hypothetical protein